jgi:Phage tail tube protein
MPIDGNSRLIYVGKQTAKGTPNTTPTSVFPLSGDAAMNPNREIIQLPETDASSQRADSVVVGASPGGGWQGWLRAKDFKLIAEGIMGSVAGTTTSVATPTKVLPYYTMFDVIPGVMCTQYVDCRFSSLTVSSEALQGTQYQVEVVGLSAILGAAEPTGLALPVDTKYSHTYLTTTVGGVAPGTHDAVSLTINRNVTLLRGDMGLAIYDSQPGLFEVTGTFRRIYVNDQDYRKVHGGAAAATVLTRTVFSESLDILYQEDGTHSVDFLSSGIEYTEITVPVNVDGSPILETLTFNTKRQATWSNNLTITTKSP